MSDDERSRLHAEYHRLSHDPGCPPGCGWLDAYDAHNAPLIPVDVTAPDYDCGAGDPEAEGGAAFNTCRVKDAEAGLMRCAGCAEREAQRLVAVELQARTNYCRLLGHHWSVVKSDDGEEIVLVCMNQCQYNGLFKVVPRDE